MIFDTSISGMGYAPDEDGSYYEEVTCSICNGVGVIYYEEEDVDDTCDTCDGKGYIVIDDTCDECDGKGYIVRT